MVEIKIDTYQKVLVKILNFLSYKPRAEREIKVKLNFYLQKEKIPQEEKEDISQKILFQLKEDGYLNDRRVADLFVEGFIGTNKSKSIKTLRNSMLKKGFSRQDVDSSVSRLPVESELSGALKLAKRKLSNLKETSKFARKSKISNFLYTKGYSSVTIKAVVDTLLTLQ